MSTSLPPRWDQGDALTTPQNQIESLQQALAEKSAELAAMIRLHDKCYAESEERITALEQQNAELEQRLRQCQDHDSAMVDSVNAAHEYITQRSQDVQKLVDTARAFIDTEPGYAKYQTAGQALAEALKPFEQEKK